MLKCQKWSRQKQKTYNLFYNPISGNYFELPREKFNCLDLNGDPISGLDVTLDKINRFYLRSRQFLPPLEVHGLPSTIYCVYLNDIQSVSHPRQFSINLQTI
jgi:hypothetical protein